MMNYSEDINIYQFDIQIHISDYQNSTSFAIYNKIVNVIKDKKNQQFFDNELYYIRNNELKYFILNEIHSKFHKYNETNYRSNISFSNYQEKEGSLLVCFTMIITTLLNYSATRRAIETILDDFKNILKKTTKDEFEIISRFSSKELFNPSSISNNKISGNTNNKELSQEKTDSLLNLKKMIENHQIFTKRISIAIAVVITCFLVWNQFFNTNQNEIKKIIHIELNKFKNQEKTDELYNYMQFQKYFSMLNNTIKQERDSLK